MATTVYGLYAVQMVYILHTYNYWLHQYSHHTALLLHQCTQTLPCVYRNGQSLSKVESLTPAQRHNAARLGRMVWNCYCVTVGHISLREDTQTHTFPLPTTNTLQSTLWTNIRTYLKPPKEWAGINKVCWVLSGSGYVLADHTVKLFQHLVRGACIYRHTLWRVALHLLRHSLTPKPKPQCHTYHMYYMQVCQYRSWYMHGCKACMYQSSADWRDCQVLARRSEQSYICGSAAQQIESCACINVYIYII